MLLVVAAGLGGLAVQQSREADQRRRRSAADADRRGRRRPGPRRAHRPRSPPAAPARWSPPTASRCSTAATCRELPDGQAYQLWRISGQDSQSAGVLGRGGDVTGVVTGMGPDDAVGVTVEPASGSDQPTSDPVFLVSMA